VLPDQDAVVAITANTPDMQGELNIVWDKLLPAFQDGALPENPERRANVKEFVATLKASK
jgi:hypothetical protein